MSVAPLAPPERGPATGAAGRLRVRVGARSWEYAGPVERLGRLELRRTPDGWHLVDRGVQGGVFLDGCRVHQLPVREGRRTVVTAGGPRGRRVELDVIPPAREVVTPARKAPAELVADKVVVTTGTGHRLLDGVSLALPPSSLTAVIGPSGAGKSTLLRILTGQTRPSSGAVLWRGHDLHEQAERTRFHIGVVPQEEILNGTLSVERALGFAARLRLPADTSRRDRSARVDEVIGQLGLQRHRRQRIASELSGGQRKRVSIATELLTAPPLLFLDEPTSGLDPGLDRSVMQQLRELADEDRTVVVATHSVTGLDVCDQVVVLSRGGRLAYVGPPDGLLDHFGCVDHPALFDLLQTGSLDPSGASPQPDRQRSRIPDPPRRPSALAQLRTLVARDVAVLLSDRLHLALLVVMPVVLAALSRVVQGDSGLSLWRTRTTPRGLMDAAEVNQRLTILVVAAALLGAAMSIRAIVGERSIFRREYAVGLSPGAYAASKALVVGGACFVQGVLVTRLALLGLPGQDRGGVHAWGWWEIALPMGLLATAVALTGLWASAAVRAVDHAMPALVGIVMVQLVMSSSLVKLAGRPVLDQLSWLTPSRWAFAAASSSADVERAHRGVAGAVHDPLFTFAVHRWQENVLCVALLGLAAALLLVRAVRRSVRTG